MKSIGDEYASIASSVFGMIAGGPLPRFSASAVDWNKFFRCDETNEPKLELVKLRLIQFLRNIDDLPDEATMEDITTVVKSCNEDIKNVVPCQLGEFRLLILAQLASLTGFILRPRALLRNLIYPVKGAASYHHMAGEMKVPEMHFEYVMESICREMNWIYCRNVAETMLCESLPGRREWIFDILIRGQDLFRLDSTGRPLRKRWSRLVWEDLETSLKNENRFSRP